MSILSNQLENINSKQGSWKNSQNETAKGENGLDMFGTIFMFFLTLNVVLEQQLLMH